MGAGEMPDAAKFGDQGCNTLGNLSRKVEGGLQLPNLARLGLGNIVSIRGVPPDPRCVGGWGKCAEASAAKDTTLGHWEIAGVISRLAFPTYPDGFPPEVLHAFEREIGVGTLGNIPASGTDIIRKLGDEHVSTRKPIVYTSADSVFQIAAHESVYPPEKLYEMCRIARRLLDGPHRVGRVIARPFTGPKGAYVRTTNRKDFSVPPPGQTLLAAAKEAGLASVGVGKIGDIFCHDGLTSEVHAKGNEQGIIGTLMQINEAPDGVIFTNLIDTDMLFGHRNDCVGYKRALEHFDSHVPRFLNAMDKLDLLIITADHGCDPTMPGTDHTREYVPLLVYSRQMQGGVALGERRSFADIAATVVEHLEIPWKGSGSSFLSSLNLKPHQPFPL